MFSFWWKLCYVIYKLFKWKKIFNIEINCLSIIIVYYLELNKENKIKWFKLIIQYLVNYSMNLKRELMNSILLISQYLILYWRNNKY